MGRARLALGIFSGAAAGIVGGYCWATLTWEYWWMAAAAALPALVLLVLPAPRQAAAPAEEAATPSASAPRRIPPLRRAQAGDPVHRLLGRLMVDRYAMITQAQLEEALARQRGTPRLLGEVLMEMGLITVADLRRVLEDQRLGGDLWHPMDQADPTENKDRSYMAGKVR